MVPTLVDVVVHKVHAVQGDFSAHQGYLELVVPRDVGQ